MRKTLIFALMGLFSLSALAQSSPPTAGTAANSVRRAAEEFLKRQTSGLPGEVSFNLGTLNEERAANCLNPEVAFPKGARTWGRTTLMIQCDGEKRWTLYLSVHIRVVTDYLISARPIPLGQIISEADLARQRGDLSDLPTNTLTEPSLAIGRLANASISAGAPLRSDLLRQPTLVQQGQHVKVVAKGAGFSVSNEGQALNAAGENQVVRVRLESGQTVSGIAKADGSVEIAN